jgi:hypothetical protein
MIPIENFLEIQSAMTVLSFEVRQNTEKAHVLRRREFFKNN